MIFRLRGIGLNFYNFFVPIYIFSWILVYLNFILLPNLALVLCQKRGWLVFKIFFYYRMETRNKCVDDRKDNMILQYTKLAFSLLFLWNKKDLNFSTINSRKNQFNFQFFKFFCAIFYYFFVWQLWICFPCIVLEAFLASTNPRNCNDQLPMPQTTG